MGNLTKFLELRNKLRECRSADEWAPEEILRALETVMDCLDDIKHDLGVLRGQAGFE